MNVAALLERLEKVRRTPTGHIARCPAHPDKTPSLSIREADDGKLLVHCFAGCDHDAIVREWFASSVHDLMYAPPPQPGPLRYTFAWGTVRSDLRSDARGARIEVRYAASAD